MRPLARLSARSGLCATLPALSGGARLPTYAGDERPVSYVSFVTAGAFVRWLDEGAPGHGYTSQEAVDPTGPNDEYHRRACA